jgi:hypothetical protein
MIGCVTAQGIWKPAAVLIMMEEQRKILEARVREKTMPQRAVSVPVFVCSQQMAYSITPLPKD